MQVLLGGLETLSPRFSSPSRVGFPSNVPVPSPCGYPMLWAMVCMTIRFCFPVIGLFHSRHYPGKGDTGCSDWMAGWTVGKANVPTKGLGAVWARAEKKMNLQGLVKPCPWQALEGSTGEHRSAGLLVLTGHCPDHINQGLSYGNISLLHSRQDPWN